MHMSYLEYKLVPTRSFTVIRNCAGCGKKAPCQNTGKFRVNANGSRIDVWLIYQCSKCRHTLNLAIYERRKNTDIPAEEYQRFLDNDAQLAEEYGRSAALFQKNKAQIDHKDITYELIPLQDTTDKTVCENRRQITIRNPYGIKIRPEKLAAKILGLSANQVRKQILKGTITIASSAQTIDISVLSDPK